jgi:hypothetical protein
MDNDTGKRIEAKLDTAINLMVGLLGGIMALAVLYSSGTYSNAWEERSVFMAAITFFVTTMCLQKMIKR